MKPKDNTNTNDKLVITKNRINSVNSPEFAKKLKESSAKIMARNAEAYKELSFR